jgi:hypothetical protein
MPWMRQKILSWGMGFFWYHIEISFTFPTIITIRPKKICVSDCMVFKIRVGRSWFFFFETYKYAPSSKIKQICLFLSYYSLLIIWHAVQCFWFQTSIKCTRKWRKLGQYRNSQASIVEFGNKHGNGDEFPDFADLFFS